MVAALWVCQSGCADVAWWVVAVKRNDDLLRQLLFEYEEQDDWLIPQYSTWGMSEEERERLGHVHLLCDAGFVTKVGKHTYRLSNDGYDYLDAIRSDTVWEKTKSGAAKVGGMTLGMMRDLAVAYLKQEAAEKLGIEL